MKRAAYLTPLYFDEESYLGGGERYPLNLAKAVVQTGDWVVDIISYGDIVRRRVLPLADGVNLLVLPAAERSSGRDRLSWDILSAVSAVDLVHIHQVFSRSSEVGMLVAKLLGKPVCATDHGGGTSSVGRSLGMLELADRVTCYSRFGSSLIHTETPMELVMGGVDDVFFTPPTPPVPRDLVVYVGRLMPHKGIDRLITALPDDVPLAVCGQPYDQEYVRLLHVLAAGKRVEFLTELDDRSLREIYGRALAVVLPSVYVDWHGHTQPWPELMGFSLLEGNACGAPVICSRVGGMPEYVEDGVTGFVFDDLAQLGQRLQTLADDPGLVERLGRAGRERVTERYGLASSGAAMRSVYENVLAEQAAS